MKKSCLCTLQTRIKTWHQIVNKLLMLSLKATLCWRHVEDSIAVFIWAGAQVYSFSTHTCRSVSFRYSSSNQTKDKKMFSDSFGRRAWKRFGIVRKNVRGEGSGKNSGGERVVESIISEVLNVTRSHFSLWLEFIKYADSFSLLCWQLKLQVLVLQFPFCETDMILHFLA